MDESAHATIDIFLESTSNNQQKSLVIVDYFWSSFSILWTFWQSFNIRYFQLKSIPIKISSVMMNTAITFSQESESVWNCRQSRDLYGHRIYPKSWRAISGILRILHWNFLHNLAAVTTEPNRNQRHQHIVSSMKAFHLSANYADVRIGLTTSHST